VQISTIIKTKFKEGRVLPTHVGVGILRHKRLKKQRNKGFFYCISPVLQYFLIALLVEGIVMYSQLKNALNMDELYLLFERSPDQAQLKMIEAIQSIDIIPQLFARNLAVLFIMGPKFFRHEKKLFDTKYENSLGAIDFLFILLLGISMNLIVGVAMEIVFNFFSRLGYVNLYTDYQQAMESLQSQNFLLQILTVGFIAPLAEEIITRGLVYTRFREVRSSTVAILLSSSVFSIMHFSFVEQMVYTFLIGIGIAFAYAKFQNFAVPVLLHMAFNLSGYLFRIPLVNSYLSTVTKAGDTLIQVGFILFFTIMMNWLIRKPDVALKPEFAPKEDDSVPYDNQNPWHFGDS